jgi:Protein of unknown function (DUF1761)
MSHLLIVNYWAVLAAAFAAFMLGNVYYMALSKQWMAAHGFQKEVMQANFAKHSMRPMVICFLATYVMSFMLYGILTHMPHFDIRNGIISGVLLWIGFVATTLAVNYGFGMKGFKAYLIDSGHWLLSLVLQGWILGWFGK